MTMKNPKTTISGAIGAIAYLLPLFGLDIPEEVTNGLGALALLLIGFFAKDGVNAQSVKVELNPSILPERNRQNEVRERISKETKLKRNN